VGGLSRERPSTIRPVAGDVRDKSSAMAIKQEVPPGSHCLVVEDYANTYKATSMTLTHFSFLVLRAAVLSLRMSIRSGSLQWR